MNEAHQMHHDLLRALLPIIPRTTYQDISRLNTLVWAIVGLCLKYTVRLSAWAEVTQSCAQYAASRERRFSRLPASSEHCSLRLGSACDTGCSD